ncbi:tetratricopeptide repeat protein [Pseudoxanthomonas sp.]|uniref:tetratricopeptide repeat protein n=1 Tax=Pseudoxanthomonas sp. TaxID=1871049 RepID=UPI002639CCFB|nr:tetratricopeptide repeat protein [Pseudoxanthomonas sp.]WDS37268.1 MAG: tetratricopeptide repeat protein [Pseudoxanthomonas sp.]
MGSSEVTSTGTHPGERYRFADVVVDASAHTLVRGGQLQLLEPKAFAVLLELLRQADALVPRDQLLDQVWGHRHVTPGVLTRAIAQLRTVLDDQAQHPRFIQTQHALGYRFIGELVVGEPQQDSRLPAAADGDALPPMPPQDTAADAPAGLAAAVAVDGEAIEPHPAVVGSAAGNRWRGASRWRWPALAAVLVVLAAGAWWWREHRTTPPRDPSIAVMPFANLGGGRDNDYFTEGLALEMQDALAGVKGLTVAAPVSPAAVAAQRGDVKALGALLAVSTVLDVSVRREGRRVRINARLFDCATGYTLWSHGYDRELAGVFDTQVEIANEVVRALTGAFPQRREAIARRLEPTRDVVAFDAYLRGLEQLSRPDPQAGSANAVALFSQALAADRDFSRAQAGICRAQVADFVNRRDATALVRARTSCEQARAMDPGMSEVNLALAELHQAQGDEGKAVEYYLKAESDPSSRAAAYTGIAIMHADQGRTALAMDYFDRALALRPGDGSIHAQIGYRQFLASDLPAAIASYRKAVALQPDNALLWSYLGGVYLTAGQVQDAERALVRSLAIEPGYVALTNLGEIKYLSGRYAEAVELQRRAVQMDPSDYVTWGNLAQAELADPASTRQAKQAFAQAAERAQRYVEIKADDAKVLAALAWYQANLGQPALARQLMARAEALGSEPGEVALYNAQTLVALGDPGQAARRIAAARAAGIVEQRISGNAALRPAIAIAPTQAPQSLSTDRNTPPTPGE